MNLFLLGGLSALWLGILTSISPCPLATNIAAISYLGRQAEHTDRVFANGLMYTLGRTATYVLLAALSVLAVLSVPHLSFLLQRYMSRVMGPILLLVGLFLLEIIRLPSFNLAGDKELPASEGKRGIGGAGVLGMLFALSFCPTSAALFFGSLIPLAIGSRSVVMFPALYGLGTALPVFVFAVLIALGAKSVAAAFQHLTALEVWAKRITGTLFMIIGVYFCWTYLAL
jgi:cytochrome c biogenesis protein CcdA